MVSEGSASTRPDSRLKHWHSPDFRDKEHVRLSDVPSTPLCQASAPTRIRILLASPPFHTLRVTTVLNLPPDKYCHHPISSALGVLFCNVTPVHQVEIGDHRTRLRRAHTALSKLDR